MAKAGGRGWRGLVLAGGIVMLIGAPLLGAALGGRPLGPLLDLPPRPRAPAEQPEFSWIAFSLLAVPVVAMAMWLGARVARARGAAERPIGRPFPAWGVAGLVLLASAWFVAWTRVPALEAIQRHTFTPLWIGFVVVLNALVEMRTGASALAHAPRRVLTLTVFSAAFWWFFEYLNSFVGNWHYVGVDAFDDPEYVLFATLAFATVLPAIDATIALALSFGRIDRAFRDLPAVRVPPRPAALGAFAAGAAMLVGVGVSPSVFFPVVWFAPLLVVAPLLALAGDRVDLEPLAQGDWRCVCVPALAALACGFFWEMWNWGSLAGWRYEVPFVDRFDLFHMPILGYAGYLPFGVECSVIIALVAGPRFATSRP